MSISPAEFKRLEDAGYQAPTQRDCCGRCQFSTLEASAPAFRCSKHRIPVAKLGFCKDYIKAGKAQNDHQNSSTV